MDGRPDQSEQLRADWAEARWRVAAYLRASLGPESPDGDAVRGTILGELAKGTMDQFAAFVDTLAVLHLTVLLQDVECDQEQVAADIRTLTEPSADRFFEGLLQRVKTHTVTLPD